MKLLNLLNFNHLHDFEEVQSGFEPLYELLQSSA